MNLIWARVSISERPGSPENRGIDDPDSQPIRVVVSDLSGILADIVTGTLRAAPDIAVTVAPGPDVLAIDADVAVVAGDVQGLSPLGRELLRRHPWMQVMAIRRDGRATSLYELRPYERKLGEISPQTLLAAIRRARADRSWAARRS